MHVPLAFNLRRCEKVRRHCFELCSSMDSSHMAVCMSVVWFGVGLNVWLYLFCSSTETNLVGG